MPFTRDANLNFNNATKIIHNKPQTFEEDCIFEKDIDVTGNLAVTGSFTFAGPPPVWVLAPLTLSNTLTLDGAGALGDFVTDNGDITATAGNIEATAGTITAGSDIATTGGDVLVPVGNVTVGTGNVAIATAGNFTSLLGDVVLTQGNVEVTTGDVAVTTGNVEVGTGNVQITTAGNFTTLLGDFESTAGDLTLTNGDATITQGNLSVLNTVPGTDGNVTVGRTIELLSNAAAIAPAAGGGTLTDVVGDLVWRVGTVEHKISHTDAYNMRDSAQVAGGAAGGICTIPVANGHFVSIQGTVSVIDNTDPTKYAFFDVQGLVTATGGVAALIDSSCTQHADTITLGAPVAVAVALGNVTLTAAAHAAHPCSFHGDIRVMDVVAIIP